MTSIGNSPRPVNHRPANVAPGFPWRKISLMHPELNVPAEATSISYYYGNGRRGKAIGYVLEFADCTVSLTHAEIENLQAALNPKPARKSSVPAGYSFADANAELFS